MSEGAVKGAVSEVNLTRGLLERRWRGKRRPIEVARDILQACLVAPTPPTTIMYRARLNPAVLQKYVVFLAGRGLISEVGPRVGWGGRRRYMATPEGRYLHRAILDYLEAEELVAKRAEEVVAQLSPQPNSSPNHTDTDAKP